MVKHLGIENIFVNIFFKIGKNALFSASGWNPLLHIIPPRSGIFIFFIANCCDYPSFHLTCLFPDKFVSWHIANFSIILYQSNLIISSVSSSSLSWDEIKTINVNQVRKNSCILRIGTEKNCLVKLVGFDTMFNLNQKGQFTNFVSITKYIRLRSVTNKAQTPWMISQDKKVDTLDFALYQIYYSFGTIQTCIKYKCLLSIIDAIYC